MLYDSFIQFPGLFLSEEGDDGEGGSGGQDPPEPEEDGQEPSPEEGEDQEIAKLRREAAKYRTERNELRNEFDTFKAKVGKALGLGDDGEEDPAEKVSAVQSQLRQERLENSVHRVAPKLDADPELVWALALAQNRLDGFDTEDKSSLDGEISKVVKELVEANPRLKVEPTPSKGGGAEITGGGGQSGGDMNAIIRSAFKR